MPRAELHVNKINDKTEPNTVNDIADDSPESILSFVFDPTGADLAVTAGSGIGSTETTAGRVTYLLATTTGCGGGVVTGSLEADAGDEFHARNAR